MTQIILIIVGIAIVAILLSRKTREQVAGICAAAIGQDAKKREYLDELEKEGKVEQVGKVGKSALREYNETIINKITNKINP